VGWWFARQPPPPKPSSDRDLLRPCFNAKTGLQSLSFSGGGGSSGGSVPPNKALELTGRRSACQAPQLPAAGHGRDGGPGTTHRRPADGTWYIHGPAAQCLVR